MSMAHEPDTVTGRPSPNLATQGPELLLQQAFPHTTQAETSFHQALLDISPGARQAKSLELRRRYQPRSPLAAARKASGSP